MTQRNASTPANKKPLLTHLRRCNEATTSLPIANGPAWCARAVTPTRLSPILGVFFAALAATPLTTHAGDLLRGGAGAGARGNATGVNPSSAQATSQARANAQDILSRTTQAVQAVQAMQKAARAAAIGGPDNAGRNPANGLQLPNVPNGLTPGGLVPEAGGKWTGAHQPTQTTTSGGQTTVNITQTTSQAVLTWSSFNIGKKTTLNFDQSFGGSQTSQWTAFNIVNDPTGVPSQILGSIKASGQVFVVNRNGIIFGGSSQVNTHAFFASSLPINSNLITQGLLSNPDEQFLFSGLPIPQGANGTPGFTPDAPYGSDYGDVTVEAGATLTAPTTSSHVGGRVVLAGRNVTNFGSISTPDGQTILAAGRQIGFVAHASKNANVKDPTLRGLDAYIGAVDASSGVATNAGWIDVPRGDAMITGKAVEQNGVIDSTTTVTLNGRVDLLANYNSKAVKNGAGTLIFFPTSTGTVSFGDESLTRILPEWSSSETNVGSQLPLPSQVIVQGRDIHMGKNAVLLAPGATAPPDPNNPGAILGAQDEAGNQQSSGVTFSAGSWVIVNTNDNFVNDGGRITLDSGATIDVSGSTNVMVSTGQSILSVQLRGTELADSPTQRQGIFRGTTIQVDIRNSGVYNGAYWVGTPLANVSGFVGLIQHNVGELTVAGGTTSLNAGGSVVIESGATINVSGGWVHYTGGMVQTSRVVAGDHVVDVSRATPDQVYQGFYTGRFTDFHDQWGVANVFSSPLALTGAHYENAYDQGANGGTLSIVAPSMVLNGNLLGNTITGDRQLRTTTTSSTLPNPSSLKLSFTAQDPSFGTNYPTFSPTPPNITFQSEPVLTPTSALTYDSSFRLTGPSAANVVLSSKLLTDDGFGSLTIDNRDGNITLPSKVALKTVPTGSVTMTGANIDIEGSITAPSGSIALNVWDISSSQFNTLTINNAAPKNPPPDTTRGNFTLGSSASLNAAGLIVDDRGGVSNLPISVNGGSITVTSYNTFLKPGSVIDVSGGVAISSTSKRTYGNGGSITINSGNDVNIPSVLGGKLELDSTLRGFSSGGGSSSLASFSGGGNGGSLSIRAAMIQIGGTPSSDGITELSPDFFNQGGFASFTLTGLGAKGSDGEFLPGINIAPGTIIAPVMQSQMAVTSSAGVYFVPVTEPAGIRTPVSLTFNAPGVSDKFDSKKALTRGDFILGAGAAILTDPLGTVTINSQTAAVLGSIVAPGGTISITTTNSDATIQLLTDHGIIHSAAPNLDLGPHSYLSTAGTVVLLPDRRGYLTGSVLPGGNITIAGNIVAEAGARLDVSGTTGILDLAPAYSNESAPLVGALSGSVTAPQQGMAVAPYRGLLIPTLPDGTSGASSYTQSGSFSGTAVVPTRVDSNGGSITLKGDTELFTDATLLGNAGGPAAKGGTLSVSSGRFLPAGSTLSLLNTYLQVTQSGPTIPTQFYGPGETAIGHPVLDSTGHPFNGSGYFAVSSFTAGGFDSLVLGGSTGTVTFSGPVSINARGSISVAAGGLLSANSTVSLQAPYVQLGMPFLGPLDQTTTVFPTNILPKNGSGRLYVTGQLIDVGNLSLQNIGQLTLTAINGDIRGDGTLDVAGDIVLQAAQIYPASAVTFTITASNYTQGAVTKPGSITILDGGIRQLPLSAGGQLNLYGAIINQGGTLRAPLGSINIGWDGTGTGPVGQLTGATVPVSSQVNFSAGSITSVSAVDPISGQGVLIPYGLDLNGTSWISPTGANITAGLVPQKSVNVSALNVNLESGSTIDLRGGGDLYAYQWVGGTGGTTDILSWNFAGAWTSGKNYSATQIVSYKGAYWYALTATTAESSAKGPTPGTYWKQVSPSFAVIPGYQADYAPYAAYNATPTAADALNLGVDQGYVNNLLQVGSQIYLNATPGLKAGVYTLLPARYALLPGAFLVTPQTTASVGTFTMTDGSNIVAGYSFNNLNQSVANPQLYTTVAVTPADTLRQRASYTDYIANSYLREEAQVLGIQVVRMPSDAGSLVLSGKTSLAVDGDVYGQGADGGRGAMIDLSTSENILIGGPGGSASSGTAFLDATHLSSFGAESILIGGIRQTTGGTTTITVKTPNITVDNAGSPLVGPEIILVANQSLTLDPGADIEQKGSIPQSGLFPPPPIVIGNSATPGSSDGVLLRVSDTATTVVRPAVNLSDKVPTITIGAGANIAGQNIIIDSTAGGFLDPTATIVGQNVSLKAGTISIELDNPGALQNNPGIVLQGTALDSLLGTASLSLSAYSSIDIYGTGSITAKNLGLHASDLRGFTNDPNGTVTINAASVTLDNASAGNGPGAVSGFTPEGSLVVNAGTIYTGANTLTIDQYENVSLNATVGVVLQKTGGLASQTNLTLTTPIIVGSAQANQTITAKDGELNIFDPPPSGVSSLAQKSGLGATLNLIGKSIEQDSLIYLPSGQLSLEATTSDVTVGGTLDVSGTAQVFYDVIKYTSAGTITLRSDSGNVVLKPGSVVSVDADPNGGNAGALSVSAPNGYLSALGTMSGQGGLFGGGNGARGTNGVFSLDAKTFDATASPNISPLDTLLNAAGFTLSRTYRVRSGNVIVDGEADAFNYNIYADSGDITVAAGGYINASGITGGSINLIASGDVTLESGAKLTVAAQQFSSAGKGGSVSLEAGADINGTFDQTASVTIGSGSEIDLSVASKTASSATYGDFSGTLHLRAPQNSTSDGLGVNPILGNIIDPSSIVVEGYRIFDLTNTGGNITNSGTINTTPGSNGVITITTGTNVEGSVKAASANFINNTTGLNLLAGNPDEAALSSVLTLVPGAELINRAIPTPLTVTLASSGNTIVVPSTGSVYYFPNGTGTNKIQSTTAWTIYSSTGVATTVAANTAVVVPTGSTVTFAAGTVSYSAGGSGAITLNLLSGASSTKGNLTLGTSTSNASADWDLSTFRFGPKQVPGVLTLRAAGNLVFYNALSDGFTAVNPGDPLYQYGLMDYNPALPANAQSWSYRLTAGADFSGANYQAVQPLSQLIAETGSAVYAQLQLNQGQTTAGELGGAVGSLLLGKNYQKNSFNTGATDIPTEVATRYQVIRTGTGDITISAGADVQFLNELATIYTAGAKVQNPTVLPGGSFDMPTNDYNTSGAPVDDLGGVVLQPTASPIQYSFAGGNVTINAQQDIIHLTRIGTNLNVALSIDSSKEMPVNWLNRRGYVDPLTGQFGTSPTGEIASTTWWVDFTNYFEGVGALGGGNVTMNAGRDVYNVDGLVPTNARMPSGTPDASKMVELGGGDLTVTAGRDINGGVYYVERGTGSLSAGRSILTNASRSPSTQNLTTKATYTASQLWLPTTLFLGKGGFNVFARNDLTLGPVANPFLLPQGFNNLYTNKTYFSTYSVDDYVNATSLGGSITLAEGATEANNASTVSPLLYVWFKNVLLQVQNSSGAINTTSVANFQSWLWLDENSVGPFTTAAALLPPTLRATAFSGNINLQGNLTLSPSPTGTIDLLAAGTINGLQPTGVVTTTIAGKSTSVNTWGASTINLSDANPANIYGITTPLAYQAAIGTTALNFLIDTDVSKPGFLAAFNNLFTESGKTNNSTAAKQALHDSDVLHADDPNPVHIYSGAGDISDITLYSPKATDVLAGRDLTDIAFYLQNIQNTDISVVSAGRDIIAYDANSLLRTSATATGNILNPSAATPLAGDIQISGPGTLELLAGRNLDLGNAPSITGALPDGTRLGVTSVGNARNPYLPFAGADLIAAAGIGGPGDLSNNPNLDVTTFVSEFLKSGGSGSANYLAQLGLKSSDVTNLPPEQQASIAVQVFFLILRDAGRAHTADGTGGYPTGFAAISKLFATTKGSGNISLTSREFKTANGGNISMLAPNGNVTVGFNVIGAQPLDQGIITEDGGDINIFANGDVSLGTSRIFTLRGGNIIIWSSDGSIAAGSASKTVKSAPPTRVLLDPQSADVKTDLAGLATGGGIGVLATVTDVPPGNVDLIAPNGAVDAGDAGIRATGNLNIAATKVLNADNIQVSGTTSGTPAVVAPAAPNIGGLTSANQTQAGVSQAADDAAKRNQAQSTNQDVPDSTITVEVVGYGGGDGTSSSASEDSNR